MVFKSYDLPTVAQPGLCINSLLQQRNHPACCTAPVARPASGCLRPPQRTIQYVCGGRPATGCPRAWRNALRSALSPPRDKNLCIIRARVSPSQRFNSSIIGYSAPDIQMGKPRRLPLILLRVWVSKGFIFPPTSLLPLEALPRRKFHDATEFPRLGQCSGKLDILAEQGILPPR